MNRIPMTSERKLDEFKNFADTIFSAHHFKNPHCDSFHVIWWFDMLPSERGHSLLQSAILGQNSDDFLHAYLMK